MKDNCRKGAFTMNLNKIKQNYINLPIYKKLLIIFGFFSLILLTVFFTVIQYTFINSQNLLYSSISSLMKNPAAEISRQIDIAKDLSQNLLSNSVIQNSLSTLKDSGDIANVNPYTHTYSNISEVIYDYYYSYQTNCISYITITNGKATLSTYNKGNKLSSQTVKNISQQAEDAKGNPVLITDYAKPYGIFLARTIRRMDSLRLDTLGTIIININLDSLIENATQTISLTEDVAYMLSNENESISFYASESISQTEIKIPKDKGYAIKKIDKDKYFVTKGRIPNYNWEYLCLIKYNSILASYSQTKFICILVVLFAMLIVFPVFQKILQSLTVHFDILVEKMITFGRNDSVLPTSNYNYSNRKDEIGTLHNQFDIMAEKIQTLINENYKNELLKKDMLLKNLQNQINPHFLYNTLESINWRAKASGEKEISLMVEALGALLRTSLSPQSSDSTIQSEMTIVHHYITIQKIRYENRLIYSEYIDPKSEQITVPLLIIQPLVENSIRYGLESNIGECYIKIFINVIDKNLCIEVLNNGSQFEENMMDKLKNKEIIPHGFGIGIMNIHKRIQMIYGDSFGVNLSNPDEDHALSKITLPLNDKK